MIRLWMLLATLSISVAGLAECRSEELELHAVPAPIKSYRLLSMSMDDDGFIWVGSIHQLLHRYVPRTGDVKDIPLPASATASSCICAGKKVYILGQTYPRLIALDRTTGAFTEFDYPSSRPNVWYGTQVIGDRFLYFFDRGSAGVIKWDTRTDTGTAIPWPYDAPLPASGQYDLRDNAIWIRVWDLAGDQYTPVGIARLDAASDQFTGFFPFPKNDDLLEPFSNPETTFFLPYTLEGQLVPFDFKQNRWCQFLPVPRHGELFGFLGGPITHQGRSYFSLSTYNGTNTGCDGKPYHFLNAILEFDPKAQEFEFLTLEMDDAYPQIAYMLSANGEFFATGSNIREPDGSLNRDRRGEVTFWQTVRPERKNPLGNSPP